METARIFMRGLALVIIVMLLMPPGMQAQDAGGPADDRFSQEELAQMLAPIALYPDSVIAQILMASTYPLEVVEAERWLRTNKGLTGDALDNALLDKTWDPSVKSLCHYPDVLYAMSDRLDQTRKLGDAYLEQPDDVMATIQDLRRRAEQQGNLKTTEQQTVYHEDPYIMIEPVDPQVVYVPVYDPLYVYGPWWYPAYPPWYWYYPPTVIVTGGFIAFGPPFFLGFGIYSWCGFNWGSRVIIVDYNKSRHFDRHHRRDFDSGRHNWQHNPAHRRGVAYRDRRTSERFGQERPRRREAGQEVRGYPPGDRRPRATDQQGQRTEQRRVPTQSGERVERERSREQVQERPGAATQRERMERDRGRGGSVRETPFGGVGSGSFERRAGERGGESRRSSEPRYQRPDRGRQSTPQGGSFQRSVQPASPPSSIHQGGSPGGGRQSGGQGGGRQGGGAPSGGGGGGHRR